ncbi:Acyl carrier protein [termite gut metagenome]|uniref:Acyl carrier protein n=1 Tax=termite gut metagenome TaxID=433724 RepID=A0A5J4SS05_9ZZZZ
MENKVLEIINTIRISKDMSTLTSIQPEDNLRNNIGFTSFDLAELTVRIEDEFGIDVFEDGLVNTIGEIYQKLR